LPSEPRHAIDATERLAALPEDVRAAFARVRALLLDADGVLTDGRVHVSTDGVESMSFDIRDGSGIWLLHHAGIKVGVITGRRTGIPELRARSVPIDEVRAGVRKKAAEVRDVLAGWGIAPEEAAFVGDDVLDGPALAVVGLPIAVADAVPDVRAMVRYVTVHGGGRGAVREVADLILEARGERRALLERMFGPSAQED
jgi:3-deoxy-D-manno-octulosonate 8-phosphate phosphatase (KDO 8-P phosphatase)